MYGVFFLAASCETHSMMNKTTVPHHIICLSAHRPTKYKRGKRQRRRDSIRLKMASSSSPAQLAAQMLGSLARVGAFVGVGATAVASAMYDGTMRDRILFSDLGRRLRRRRHPFLYNNCTF